MYIAERVTRESLYVLEQQLTPKHRYIIEILSVVRAATGKQLERLHFSTPNRATRIRMCNYTLKRMTDLKVLVREREPSGGLGGGSDPYYYALDRPGQVIAWPDKTSRGKYWQDPYPDPTYLRHRLGITEVFVAANEAIKDGFVLRTYQPEPQCWRHLPMELRRRVRPDAYLALSDGQRLHHWFIEVDMGSEWPKRINEKLNTYYRYYQSGYEQHDLKGVFPLVLWLVPDRKRQGQIQALIDRHPQPAQRLFRVELQAEAYQVLTKMS